MIEEAKKHLNFKNGKGTCPACKKAEALKHNLLKNAIYDFICTACGYKVTALRCLNIRDAAIELQKWALGNARP